MRSQHVDQRRVRDVVAVVLAGGNEYIGAGATASGTIVNAGGLQYIDVGGSATATSVNGGYVFVAGTASGAVVTSGEFDWVLSKIEQDEAYEG